MKKKLIISLFLLLSLFSVPTYAANSEDATEYYNQAIDLYGQDNINGSIELFNKAIKLKPDFYEAHYNLSQIYMSVDKNEEALKELEQLLILNPNDTDSLYNYGKIQYKRGYLSDSLKHLTKIPTSAPQYESARILKEKIEKRQAELALENTIKQHKNEVDANGLTLSTEIGEFQTPSGVAADNSGNIYIASFAQNKINKIATVGKKTVFSSSSLIKGPIGLAIDKSDNVYVANYSANNIVKITPSGQATIFANVQKPYCIFYDAKNDRLYVTEQQTNKILKLDL